MKKEISIHHLGNECVDDFIQLTELFKRVFELAKSIPPQKEYLQKLLSDERFLVFVAKKHNRIVGGLTIYLLDQYHRNRPMALLYDLAVEQSHQRKGIGQELISKSKAYCKSIHVEEIFLFAENVDDHAIDFYRRTKVSGEDAVTHFYYHL